MNKKLSLFLLTPVLFSCAGNGGNTPKEDLGPVDVILISGQSNAVGCTQSYYIKMSMDLADYYEFEDGYENIKISYDCWTKDGFDTGNYTYYSQNDSGDEFVPVKLGQGNNHNTFGPEIGIAKTLHEKYGNKLFIIKFACGASNLKDDWTNRESPMYPRFISYVKKAMQQLSNQGYRPVIKAFCWMQGEGDAWGADYYSYYKRNTETFVGQVREDLKDLGGNKEIPFIDAMISSTGQAQCWSQVNKAKKEFSETSENNFVINTIQEGLHTTNEPPGTADIDHYDSDSMVKLGELFAQKIEPFLEQTE